MKPEELEAALRKLWTKSQVPFDRSNLSAYTGLVDKKLDRRLTGLVKSGTLGVDTNAGEIIWTMPGLRPIEGPETLERFERLERMREEVKARVRANAEAKRTGKPVSEVIQPSADTRLAKRDKTSIKRSAKRSDSETSDENDPSILRMGGKAAKGALSLMSGAAGKLDRKGTGGKKSLLASAALSFMGPLGWLYAGSFREAVPAVAVFSLLAWIIPTPLLWPLLWFALPVSSLAGAAYAWQYNRAGERRSLFLSGPDDDD